MTVRTAISHPWRPETIRTIISRYDTESELLCAKIDTPKPMSRWAF